MSDTQNSNEDNIRALREKAERADAAEQAAADLQRKVTFYEAGVDPTSPLGELLFASFDGDAAALKAKATDLGYFKTSEPTDTAPKYSQEETTQQTMRQVVAGGGTPNPMTDLGPDPWDEGYVQFHEAIRSGTPREEAQQDLLAKIIRAGTGERPDPRVGWNPRDYYREADRMASLES